MKDIDWFKPEQVMVFEHDGVRWLWDAPQGVSGCRGTATGQCFSPIRGGLMHDPMVVVFEIRRPWPSRHKGPSLHSKRWKIGGAFWTLAGRTFYWPDLITVWHVEPKGHDSGTVCKGMGGTELTFHNLMWAARHIRHLSVQVQPYLRVKRWLFCRCAECGRRFFWKDSRFGYMNSDDVYHDQCMTLRHVRSQLDDLTAYMRGEADSNQRWRATRRLDNLARWEKITSRRSQPGET